jgi:hypothetical protein
VARILKRVRSPLEFEVLVHLAAERLRVREELLRGEGMRRTPEPRRRASGGDRAPGPRSGWSRSWRWTRRSWRGVLGEQVIAEFDHPTWRKAAEALAAAAGDERRAPWCRRCPRQIAGPRCAAAHRRRSEMNHEAEAVGCIAQIHARTHRARAEAPAGSHALRGGAGGRGDGRRGAAVASGHEDQATEKARGQRSPS